MGVAQGASAEGQGPLAHRVHGGLRVVGMRHVVQLGRRCHWHVVGHRRGRQGLCGRRSAVVDGAEDVLPEGRCPGVVLARCCALVVRG